MSNFETPQFTKIPEAPYASQPPPVYVGQPNMGQGIQVQYVQQARPQIVTGVPYVGAIPLPGSSIYSINDWLAWSIINIFLGWLFAGIIPLIFSLMCRNYKQSNNESSARTMSTLALVFNILATLGGIGGWIALIVVIVTIRNTTCSIYYPYLCR